MTKKFSIEQKVKFCLEARKGLGRVIDSLIELPITPKTEKNLGEAFDLMHFFIIRKKGLKKK
ncbi:MAG: hypothetical protein ABIE23_01630 [archaeon]|nr:hypothetical protein [Candidatus Micrarchaeota archaeon]